MKLTSRLVVHGKGGKERVAYVLAEMEAALTDWLRLRRRSRGGARVADPLHR